MGVRVLKDIYSHTLKMKPGAPYRSDLIDHDAHGFPRSYSTFCIIFLLYGVSAALSRADTNDVIYR